MKTYHIIICTLLIASTGMVPVSYVEAHEYSRNNTRWEVLEGISKRINLNETMMVRQTEYYAYQWWSMYVTSSRSERPILVNELSEMLKKIAYRDTRYDTIGLILFGPVESRSFLHAKVDEGKVDPQCTRAIAYYIVKHCGPVVLNGLKHKRFFSNICFYVKDKAMIEEAIIVTCGLNNFVPSSVVDVENPTIDIDPVPYHGASGSCGRVYVKGVSRTKFQMYANAYKIMLKSLVLIDYLVPDNIPYNKVQICFHWNRSLGLCECARGDWRPVDHRVSYGPIVSPYERMFLDVKFDSGVIGKVTVALREVSKKRHRYGLLAMGVVLLFLVWTSKGDFYRKHDDYYNDMQWFMRFFVFIPIWLGTYDTLLAMIVFAICLILCYIYSSIRIASLAEWEKKRWSRNLVAGWLINPGFQDWVINNPDRIILLPDNKSR